MTHMLFKGIFSFTYQRCIRCKPLPAASGKVLFGTILVGVMTGLDVATSNQSFLYISVTFYTMLKSASLVFLMILGVITRVEPCSLKVSIAVLIIAGGVLLTSYGEAKFDILGFTLVLSSEVFAAIRWILTQMILHGSSLGTMVTVFYMSPSSTLSLLPLVMLLEREEVVVLADPAVAAQYLAVVFFPGFLAFLLLLIEVQLVKETSSLTLSVFGNLKSIVTIIFAILVFKEKASLMQWCGLMTALTGMLAYSRIKNKAMAMDALVVSYTALSEDEVEGEDPTATGKTVSSPSGSPAGAFADAEFGDGGIAGGGSESLVNEPLPVLEGLGQEADSFQSFEPQVLGKPSQLQVAGKVHKADTIALVPPRPSSSPIKDIAGGAAPEGGEPRGRGAEAAEVGAPGTGLGLDSPSQVSSEDGEGGRRPDGADGGTGDTGAPEASGEASEGLLVAPPSGTGMTPEAEQGPSL
eukprot:CAMPEP_0179107648 /NCGR_PEP_ID=MMETSP0796-20121207/50110_1 /TAXON_ID=73915 /ORGANISM="Pyrodinium bahamense, Strain pbaha01" /LENGTH=466 /DNA_ID=CAMNT_0020805709 /DNA_START=263 /DNA_END=1663 /DNA_ORIENTATION=-